MAFLRLTPDRTQYVSLKNTIWIDPSDISMIWTNDDGKTEIWFKSDHDFKLIVEEPVEEILGMLPRNK